MNRKTLIHTAFFTEAKAIVEYFGLNCTHTKTHKIYSNQEIVLFVSGMGRKNTLHVEEIFRDFEIKRAINIGIAGCKNRDREIGSLFCTNQKLTDISYADITSVSKPLNDKSVLKTTLVDMEAEAFLEVCKKELSMESIFVFKIVSDYLDTTIPKKEFVENLIKNSIKKWKIYV